ncbi:MAG TPA: cell division protein FtsQ/DivIB [Ignavibacteriaceae bacterium]
MKERLKKFFSLAAFVVLIGVIISLGISSASTDDLNIFSSIEVTGGRLLTPDSYLSFTGFTDSSKLSDVTLASVKSTFEKHPYILKADVEFDGDSKILVEIYERNFIAVLYEKQKFSLVTENYEIVPVRKNTAFHELPIITNVKIIKRKELSKTNPSQDILQAFKIIDALKFCDEEMFNSLAEINLNKGGDVVLSFTGLNFPVIFGRGNEARKILSLKAVWNELINSKDIYSGGEYLDLRFGNQIFIGYTETKVSKG